MNSKFCPIEFFNCSTLAPAIAGIANKKEILLPSYWAKLVDWTTITVNLTPVGAHQNVIVKRIDKDKVYLEIRKVKITY